MRLIYSARPLRYVSRVQGGGSIADARVVSGKTWVYRDWCCNIAWKTVSFDGALLTYVVYLRFSILPTLHEKPIKFAGLFECLCFLLSETTP